MLRVINTVNASTTGCEQLKSSLTSSSGTRDKDEWQDFSVSFTPLILHTAQLSSGSSVETVTVESLSGRTTVCRDSEGTQVVVDQMMG